MKLSPIDKRRVLLFGLEGFIFFLFLVVGILLRTYRISEESISLEEYACIANLNVKNLFEFISLQRNTYPYGGILFPLMQYVWARIFGGEIVSLRMFSIFFWCLFYIVILFFIKKKEKEGIIQRGTGIFIGVGIVFSPALIFLGQEARMYMAYIFFVWCSGIFFYLFLTTPNSRVYPLLLFLVNQCLLWVHHVGILIWCSEALLGLSYCIHSLRYRKRMLCILAIHGVSLIPWLLWLVTIPSQPRELYQYYLRPGFKELALFPVIGNIVVEGGICPSGVKEYWSFLPAVFGNILDKSMVVGKWGLIILAYLSLVGIVMEVLRCVVRENDQTLNLMKVIVGIFILPVLLLFIISCFGPPIFTTRYISFIIPLHFFGLSFLLKPFKIYHKFIVFIFLILCLFYQLGMMLPGPWRMDWKGVGYAIKNSLSKRDLVLIRDPFWVKIFEINNKDFPVPTSSAYTYNGLVDLSKAYITIGKKLNYEAIVWIVVPDVYGEGSPTLAPELEQAGFEMEINEFLGEQRIWLYRVWTRSHFPLVQNSLLNSMFFPLAKYLSYSQGRFFEFVEKRYYEHDNTEFHYIRCAKDLIEFNWLEEADALLYRAWDNNPNQFIQSIEWLPLSLLEQGESGEDRGREVHKLFIEGLKCFYENDYTSALGYYMQMLENKVEDPLIFWCTARAYDELGFFEAGDFYWGQVFRLKPILPIGWHFIYKPAVLSLDVRELKNELVRAERLDIITNHINYVWERLLK